MSQGIEKGNQLNIRIIVSPPQNSTKDLATHVQRNIQRNIQKHCLNKNKAKSRNSQNWIGRIGGLVFNLAMNTRPLLVLLFFLGEKVVFLGRRRVEWCRRLMHFLLALNKPASIQSIYSIAKGQYRISNTGKTNTKCLSSTETQLLFGKTFGF